MTSAASRARAELVAGPSFVLAILGSVHVRATSAGLRLTTAADIPADALSAHTTWPPDALAAPGGLQTALDVEILLEQGVADLDATGFSLPTESVGSAMEDRIGLPTRWTEPSPLSIQVDREGEIGRPSFAYQYRWLLDGRPATVQRLGAYARLAASGRIVHLDARTVALVEAMDAFNAAPPAERAPAAAWGTYARVRADAEAVGAELDAYLESNTVVVPSQISCDVATHDDGSVSFVPRAPEVASDGFARAFLASRAVQPTYAVTQPDGGRVRIVVEPRHRAVLDRMTRVRRATGEARARALREPEAVFDGVLGDVELTFGPRVTGVGEFQFTPQPADPRSGSFLGELRGPQPATDGDHAVGDAGARTDSPIAQPRVPATLTLPRADGSGDVAVRFTSANEVDTFRAAAKSAHTLGQDIVDWNGVPVRVEPAALATLDAGANAEPVATARGRDGRLYLLIHDNDEVLRDSDLEQVQAARDRNSTQVPLRLPRSLRPDVQLRAHQQDGVRWLDGCRQIIGRMGVLLADDMGLGKTLQILVHLANVIEDGGLANRPGQGDGPPWRPILIIAPLILVENETWPAEMAARFTHDGELFRPLLKLHGSGIDAVRAAADERDPLGSARLDPAKLMLYRVVITTYETLVNHQHSLAQHVDERPLWTVVVSDEAQRAKSMHTKISVALKAVTPGFHVAATGTPVENRLLDLWNIVDTVQPGLLGTAREFTRTYETPLASGVDAQRATLDALRGELLFGAPHAFLVRRNKEQLADLPPKTERVIKCPMGDAEAARHAELVGALSAPGLGTRVLGLLQDLARTSQHPWLGDGDLPTLDVDALVGASAKLEATLAVLAAIAARREKVLVFARLVAAQQMLARVIGARYRRHVDVLNGETKRAGGGRDVRRQMLTRFREAPGFGAIVLSPFVAGVGLTITEANHVVHYGRWWNPAVEGQATDRAYRIGQTKPVTVYYPVLTDPTGRLPRGTFDEALHALVLRKRALATDFLHPAPENDAADAAEVRATLTNTAFSPSDDASHATT